MKIQFLYIEFLYIVIIVYIRIYFLVIFQLPVLNTQFLGPEVYLLSTLGPTPESVLRRHQPSPKSQNLQESVESHFSKHCFLSATPV